MAKSNKEKQKVLELPLVEVDQNNPPEGKQEVDYQIIIGKLKDGQLYFVPEGTIDIVKILGLIGYGREHVQRLLNNSYVKTQKE